MTEHDSEQGHSVTPRQWACIRHILRTHLNPSDVKAYVFGSRANGRARRDSDLDLVLHAQHALALDQLSYLREAFENSDLPYRVDIIDYHRISPEFRAKVRSVWRKIDFTQCD